MPLSKPADARAVAKSKLLQARAQLSQGNFDTAEALANEVAKQKLPYAATEDSPVKVLKDVAAGRQDPKLLLTGARSALARKEFDQAEKFAKLADKNGSVFTFPAWGDSPAAALKDIAKARKTAAAMAKAAPLENGPRAQDGPRPDEYPDSEDG